MLAAANGLALTSFAVGGATMTALNATADAADELALYDSLNLDIAQPAAAVIELGSNGEGEPAV